jgi:thymidylate kinase
MKIAIIGSPGSGKTTLCFGLYYYLKKASKRVEFVPELIKVKVYQAKSKDEFLLEGFDIHNNLEQRKFERIFDEIQPPLDFIICEAPLCNSYFYASFYKKDDEAKILKKIAMNTINNYDIILKLKFNQDKTNYETHGRNESFEESLSLDNHIFNEFNKLNYKNKIIEVDNRDDIDTIVQQLLKLN